MKRFALLTGLLLLSAFGAEEAAPPEEPADRIPAGALAFAQVDSLSGLVRALKTSGFYTGAFDGVWASAGAGVLEQAKVDPEPVRPVAWDWLEALGPALKGPVAVAWLPEGPVALARDVDLKAVQEWAGREARVRKLDLVREKAGDWEILGSPALRLWAAFRPTELNPWLFVGRDRKLVERLLSAPPAAPLSASADYRRLRLETPGQVFCTLSPGALARAGLLGERLRAAVPGCDALGWGCSYPAKGSGFTDTVRLLRPGRKPLLPVGPSRLAGSLPAGGALRVTGRLSAVRLRDALECLLGQNLPLPSGFQDWEGEVALSAGWGALLPNFLLGLETPDPKALLKSLAERARAEGGQAMEFEGHPGVWLLALPGLMVPCAMEAGEKALWIGMDPVQVENAGKAAAGAAAPDPGPPGFRATVRLPELFGPLPDFLAGQGQPVPPILKTRAVCDLSVEEDGGGMTVRVRSPWGGQPLAGFGVLAWQALRARDVLEDPRVTADRVTAGMPALRGLPFLKPLDLQVVTSEETHALFEKEFAKEMPPEKMEAQQESMLAFGLLEPGQDLRRILTGAFVDLVGGFYDPETKKLYLIRGVPAQGMIAAHEMTHALQDQHFDLKAIQEAQGKQEDSDREAGLLACIEGDATVIMMDYLQQGGGPAQGLRMLLEILVNPGWASGQLAALAAMPPALLREATFPYEDGKEFVEKVRQARGLPGVDALFKDPPASTEQVLHPEKFLGAKRDEPVGVPLPPGKLEARLGPGWKSLNADTRGELGIQAALRCFLPEAEADQAAAGWGGDRFVLLSREADRLLVWRTAWDSEADAGEFEQALRQSLEKRFGPAKAGIFTHGASSARILHTGNRVDLLDGVSRAVLGQAGETLLRD